MRARRGGHIIRKVRNYDAGFTIIDNHAARNVILSRAARGLLWELHSHSADYRLTHAGLETASKDGAARLQTAVNELKKAGYLRIDKIREGGKIIGSVWNLTDNPDVAPLTAVQPYLDFPDAVFPDAVSPDPVKQAQRSTKGKKTKQKNIALAGEIDPREGQFEKLWKLDRRGKKKKAREQFMKAVPKRVDFDTVYEARQSANAAASHVNFVEYMDTWLRDDGWTIVYTVEKKGRTDDAYDPLADLERMKREANDV